jgi:hypothetical protein
MNGKEESEVRPADAYREEMWAVISKSWAEQTTRQRRLRKAHAWTGVGLGLAAMLVVGIFIGRTTSEAEDPVSPAVAIRAAPVRAGQAISTPIRIAVGEHFREVETLLLLFGSSQQTDAELMGLARELAATSRMLMASDAGRDAEVRSMLLDLELLLVQIARLVDSTDATETEVVKDGIAETEAVPRMRRFLADAAVPVGI